MVNYMKESTSSLTQIRASISNIDQQILSLLAQRRKISLNVAKHKVETQKPVRDLEREQLLLSKLVSDGQQHDLDPLYITKIFQTIIEDSVRYQQEYLQRLSNPTIEQPLARVCFLGAVGSYSNLAANQYFSRKNTQLIEIPCSDFKNVIEMVEMGNADYGILPIENTSSGSINEVYDQLQHTHLWIVGEITQAIEHCLLTAVKTDLTHINNIYSHPQPQQQCNLFLNSLCNIKYKFCKSSTEAMKKVAKLQSPHIAAIGNATSGKNYGLQPLQFNIANQEQNYTRFILVARKPLEVTSLIPAKTTFIMSTSHATGSLVECLLVLKNNGINMTKLESRPILQNPWEEMFYVDVQSNVNSEQMKNAIKELTNLTRYFKVLGCYPIEIIPPANLT